MDQKKKHNHVFTTVEIVYTKTNYIDRLNQFLSPSHDYDLTTAHWNKPVEILAKNKVDKIKTKYKRPLIVFNFNKHADANQCFPLSSYKSGKDKLDDQRYGYVEDNGKIKGKVVLIKPILIPTKYLLVININNEINNEKVPQIKEWLHNLNIEKREFVKKAQIFKNQYLNIKYSREVNYINYAKANKQLINEMKVEQFCNLELKKIKQEELSTTKSKQNQDGGSSGTPIEEEKNSKIKVNTSASEKLLVEHWKNINKGIHNQTNLQQKNVVSHNDDYLQSSHHQSQKIRYR